ncbi:uncharacterized protein SCHCODRAFT_02635711 [Schizophyllum commune H4-8]|nr:uncharacterized protein SCHCODRAFT_02635711 [Schizophyllum commune H4-8]KAI5889820.1 hypothetical protein SCHCODRAFT_02635711 [Schizophyllum commune H4-8]
MRETMRMWDDEIFPGTISSVVRRPAREGSTNNEVDQILAGIEDEEVEQSDEEDGNGRSGTQDNVEED